MTPEEIEDRESLKAWFQLLPTGTAVERDGARLLAVALAHRAAMRVLPIVVETPSDEQSPNRNFEEITVFRQNLIAGVAATNPSPKSRSAAAAMVAAASVYSQSDLTAPSYTIRAAAEALSTAAAASSPAAFFNHAATAAEMASAAFANFAYGPEGYGMNAAYAADIAGTAMWSAVRADCVVWEARRSLECIPLWSVGSSLVDLWRGIREDVLARGPDWAFWVDWYEKALKGEPQDWGGLLTDIALIPREEWDKGADHVNALIAEIRLRYAIANSYNAERVIRDAKDGLFRAEPITDLPEKVLSDATDRVRDVIKEIRAAMGSSNSYAALTPDLDRTDSYLERYGDNPLRIYECFTKSLRHAGELIAQGDCPSADMLIEDYRADLDASAIDIRESDPEVKRTLTLRARVRFDRLGVEAKAGLRALTESAAQEWQPHYAEELRADLKTTTDDRSTEKDQDESRFRLGSRLLRTIQTIRRETVSVADDAAKIDKGARVLESAGNWIAQIPGWFP